MGEDVIGLGRQPIDGGKVVKLRQRLGMKQEDLAERAHISVRHLREIERTNKPVPGTTITAIATALKVPPNEITLPASNEIASEEDSHTLKRTQLKLRAVRSASELSELAGGATRYYWKLKVDPTATTSNEMQELLQIIRRLVERDGVFEWIPRLARLQELLEALLARGVGVLAGTYYNHAWTSLEDKDPKTLLMPGERRLKLENILEIIFVPRDVEEKVICPDLDPKFEEIEKELKRLFPDDEWKTFVQKFPL